LPVAAAIAPDILAKGSKVAARVSTNALDSAAANMGLLKKTMEELDNKRYEAVFSDIPSPSTSGRAGLTPSEAAQMQRNIDQYDRVIQDIDTAIEDADIDLSNQMDEMFGFIMDDPDVLKGASDESLETLAKEFYENSQQRLSGTQIREMDANNRYPYEELAKEIRRRGLDKQMTKSGFNKYSSSKTFAADILDPKEDPWTMISAADKTVPRR